jgi:transmembrane sensor
MHDPVEDAAARWALRHPLDPAGQVELDAWLAQDPRRAGALLRAQAALSAIDRALAPDPAEAAHERPAPRPTRRWMLMSAGGAVAASVAGFVGWSQLAGARVTTERGEIRRLPLADGSIATIDTSSALRVVLGDDRRRIALDKGQAYFQVAKDRKRPFIVDAGIAQARALGTAFSVRRTEDGVQVAVTEGIVGVWAGNDSGAMTVLQAGQFATFRQGQPAPVTGTAPAAIERSLAWRSGEIALENNTLGNAVAQFNRYNREQLILADPDLASERLVGLFRLDNPVAFAETLAVSHQVSVTVTPSDIRLSRKKIASP